MKFAHTGLFIPKGISPNKVSDTRKYVFESSDNLRAGNRSTQLKSEAVKDGFINRYSMRKYWELVLGESRVSGGQWNDLEDLKSTIKSVDGIKDVKKQKDKTKESLVLVVESDADESSVKHRLESEYGSNAPVYVGYSHLEFVLSYKWLGCSDKFFFDDVIHLW